MSDVVVKIATRASRLALWQARYVADLLRACEPDCEIELVELTTTGDRDRAQPLRAFGGVGVFTREVQSAVLDGRADVAVHSLKDLPTETAAGLVLAAVPPRGPTGDVLVWPSTHSGAAGLEDVSQGARVGTGSVRRQAQLLHARPDLQPGEIRGNVETRLRKLDAGEFEVLVLAEAGLARLDLLSGRIHTPLGPPVMFPAAGQGAIGIECRAEDERVQELLSRLDDPLTRRAITAERSVLAALHAGCHAPVGVATGVDGDRLTLETVVLSPDGRTRLYHRQSGLVDEAVGIGRAAADALRSQGAEPLINP